MLQCPSLSEFLWVLITHVEFFLLSSGISSMLSPSALISTTPQWHGQRQTESPGSVRPIMSTLPNEGRTLNQTGTMCSHFSAANVRRRRFGNEEMRRRPRETTMHIALTLPLGPAIVFQLIAATLWQTTLTDGKVFVGVRRGAREIVLTGGEKWILGPNDTRSRAEPLRQISKCWSIQSAGNQEIRWRCLNRSRGYYTE